MPNTDDDDSDIDYDALRNGMLTSADPLMGRAMAVAMGIILLIIATAVAIKMHG